MNSTYLEPVKVKSVKRMHVEPVGISTNADEPVLGKSISLQLIEPVNAALHTIAEVTFL